MKNVQKFKLLLILELEEDGVDEESGREVYLQYICIKDLIVCRDVVCFGKVDCQILFRVIVYCMVNRYQMDGFMRFFKGKGKGCGVNLKLIDECIYLLYSYSFK